MWQVRPSLELPDWLIPEIRRHAPQVSGYHLAQLLLERGISTPEKLAGFLQTECYQPASPLEFGAEMERAIARLISARDRLEKVAIWGDFDADGITATSVLWDGLGEFFGESLSYTIPNRFTDSHGLHAKGIEALAEGGCTLIVTCDTGSTNLAELELANRLGIDVIVTDHHSLPDTRPPVAAIINPRNLPADHPLYYLSGVAVAYKLVEALYFELPEVPRRPLSALLDLVAIGLIADLVELRGDCRYLAQLGIQHLQKQLKTPTRPGVAKLLKFCKGSGDRPTDISFGIGPRINAVSRIHGDASFCVELLTSRDEKRCHQLALETELANTRRKELQRDVLWDVQKKLQKLDLSTTHAIVLSDPQWPVGVLGLVAGQIAQEYGRPTILLSTEGAAETGLGRGSARSVHNIDLYELVRSQAPLLHRFGGHPYAAGLSLPVENIPLFAEGIDRLLGERMGGLLSLEPVMTADFVCTVSELGYDLFQELKLLEPCGIGNPVPKFLIKNCWFGDIKNKNQTDLRGRKVRYIKTTFNLFDESCESGFPGVWWGHYEYELPRGRCDVIAELDFNAHQKQYEARLVAVRSAVGATETTPEPIQIDEIMDLRNNENRDILDLENGKKPLILKKCPTSWDEMRIWFRRAFNQGKKLAIAYSNPPNPSPVEVWETLVGIAKYLSRTHQPVTRQKLLAKLKIGDVSLKRGFDCLKCLGFQVEYQTDGEAKRQFLIRADKGAIADASHPELSALLDLFFSTIREEQFRQQYFCNVSLNTICAIAHQTILLGEEENPLGN